MKGLLSSISLLKMFPWLIWHLGRNLLVPLKETSCSTRCWKSKIYRWKGNLLILIICNPVIPFIRPNMKKPPQSSEHKVKPTQQSSLRCYWARRAGIVELRQIEAAREIAQNLSSSKNVTYVPGGQSIFIICPNSKIYPCYSMSQNAQVQMRLVFESNKSILKLLIHFTVQIQKQKVKNFEISLPLSILNVFC